MSLIAPPPLNNSIIETDETKPSRRDPFYVAKGWIAWLQNSLVPRVQNAPQLLKAVSLTNKSASIGATALPLGIIPAGRYRIDYFIKVSQAATVSSSLTVTLGFSVDGTACTQTAAAVTGNTIATTQSGSIFIRIQSNSAITYAVLYASVGGTPMKFTFDIDVTQQP